MTEIADKELECMINTVLHECISCALPRGYRQTARRISEAISPHLKSGGKAQLLAAAKETLAFLKVMFELEMRENDPRCIAMLQVAIARAEAGL